MDVKLFIPQLLPIKNKQGFTYNFPTELNISTLGINNTNEEAIFDTTYDYSIKDFDALNLKVVI